MKDNLKVILRSWGGIILEADIEEDYDQILYAVKYHDHGDSFLRVQPKDGNPCEYGWWLNRCGMPDYCDLDQDWAQRYFNRCPVLFKDFDVHHSLSNKLYSTFNNEHFGVINSSSFMAPLVCKSEQDATYRFDHICLVMSATAHQSVMYDENDYRDVVLNFLKINKIDTEENLKKFAKIKWDSRVNGIDGFAGRRERIPDDTIYAEGIDWVFRNGRFIDGSRLSVKHITEFDEWGGYDTVRLNLNQFK